MKNSNDFYTDLPLQSIPINDLLAQEDKFRSIPEDWQIIVTDIKGSTQAVQSGLHQEVNLIATGSIIAALNIAKNHNINIPFFFGGDGATLVVPQSLLDTIMQALNEHRVNSASIFNMDLRVGHVPVSAVYQNKQKLLVAKVKVSEPYAIPVIIGNGLRYAESLIKAPSFEGYQPTTAGSILDLEGMECRWDKIKPPQNNKEVVCLLVDVPDQEKHSRVFKQVLDQIRTIYGTPPERNPISIQQLRLDTSQEKVRKEMQIKIGRFDLSYLITNWLGTILGKLYFQSLRFGNTYLKKLVELSDTLVIDGRINTVISGTPTQREQLTKALDQIEQEGNMKYGIHVSQESILSCYVRDRKNQHIHFVDGADGGYTRAASILKTKPYY